MFGMQKRGQIVLGVASGAVLVFVGYVMSSGPDSTVCRYVFDRIWTSVLFAFLFFASVGFLLSLLAGLIPRENPSVAAARWKKIRSKGRTAYIRRFTFFICVPLVLAFAVIFIYQVTLKDRDSRALVALPLVVLVFIVAMILVASRNWSENEARYQEPQTDADGSAKGVTD
jgi:RsiW-degrading membrane proteinase PrsW (M82 family)